jgi:phosphatidylglycerophosphatase A
MNIFRDPVLFVAFGFGAGLAKKAPGTCGTLVGIPIYLLLVATGPAFYVVSLGALTVGGIWICQKASDRLGVHDHQGIVLDEIVGFLITMVAVPVSWQTILIGFVLFRLFDIVKPWPIRIVDERVRGGLGIMMDDVLAGVLAALVLQLMRIGFAVP